MTFQPGQSGNPGGRGKRIWRDAIHRAVMKAVEGKVDYARIDELAEQLIAQAASGDVSALKEIGDRLDGRAIQTIAGDDDGSPVVIQVIKGGKPGGSNA